MENNIKRKNLNDFKLTVVILLFFITAFHIAEVLSFSYQRIVSDRVLLGMALVLLSYLWTREIKDRQLFQENYERLVLVQMELKDSNIETIRSLVLAEEAKDPYTKGHSARVAELACIIAKKLGLPREELQILENAGILHDIGKVGIENSILHKKSKLDENEWHIIKKHPEMALDILAPLKFLPKEKEIIRHHHERFDGGGYPDGIKGMDIPIGSRILALTDAFDAMRSERPYRDRLPKEIIIQELKNNAGTQFDTRLVNILLEILDEHKQLYEKGVYV